MRDDVSEVSEPVVGRNGVGRLTQPDEPLSPHDRVLPDVPSSEKILSSSSGGFGNSIASFIIISIVVQMCIQNMESPRVGEFS